MLPRVGLTVPALLLVTGCAPSTPVNAGPPAEIPPIVASLSRGSWGYQVTNECSRNPQTITFSPDLQVMTIAFARPQPSRPRRFVYRIRSISPDRIRADMDGEDRRVRGGSLAVWDLVMRSDDLFVWELANLPGSPASRPTLRCPPTPSADGR